VEPSIDPVIGLTHPLPEDWDDVVSEIAAIEAEVLRRAQEKLYRDDPVSWAEQKCGDFLWSKQREIMHSVRDNRLTAVASCHEIGKSFIAAEVVGWWLDAFRAGDAFVVTSAPTAHQVRTILWREIGRVHARGHLRGRVNQTEWLMVPAIGGREELVAFGRKPDDYNPTAFQGIHAPRVLVVFDEACGIRAYEGGDLWEAGRSLIANDNSKWLVIGNPDDPTSEFKRVCQPGSGWHVIHVSAFDSPNFTGEPIPQKLKEVLVGPTYVEEMRNRWAKRWRWSEDGKSVVPPPGETLSETAGPAWFSKVLGVFPEQSSDNTLIPAAWIRRAQEKTIDPQGCLQCGKPKSAHRELILSHDDGHRFRTPPNELGMDVGGGGDSSTVAQRRGGYVRILWEDQNPDTMQTCGRALADLEATGASVLKVDKIGIGRGVVDRGLELAKSVVGINVGEGASDNTSYLNLRAELWWMVRELFEANAIDIDEGDTRLADELVSIRFFRTSSGKIQIESKDQAKKRGISSPNRADALMLAIARPTLPELAMS